MMAQVRRRDAKVPAAKRILNALCHYSGVTLSTPLISLVLSLSHTSTQFLLNYLARSSFSSLEMLPLYLSLPLTLSLAEPLAA
jgi:hypothetical protein